jgi:hypothetical protein
VLTFVPFHHCIPALPCPCSALELTLSHGGCYRLFLLRFFRGSSALPLAVELNCPTSTPSVPFPSRLFCSLLLLAIFFCFCVSVSCISFLVGVRFRCSALHCAQLLKSNTQYAIRVRFVSLSLSWRWFRFGWPIPSHVISHHYINIEHSFLCLALATLLARRPVPVVWLCCSVANSLQRSSLPSPSPRLSVGNALVCFVLSFVVVCGVLFSSIESVALAFACSLA